MLREPLSTTLALLPESFHSARTELLELLRRHGILHRSPTQPVLSRDGTSARWMLDSLSVTLTPRGAELAGRCLLDLLQHFDGRQIATYGLTAVPILQSCLLQSDGRYRGLLVRKERKAHGSLKLIEGPIDPNEPVVILDDSVSSGMSMEEATERLEQAGLRVEGGICLVRFGWYGGYARMQERGYHMEAVYDIWDDFIYQMEDEEKPLANPSKWFPRFNWSAQRAPEHLHPAQLARLVITEYLSSGELLRPPQQLDSDYDSSGGAWVSIRSTADLHQRHARDGFWNFPGEKSESAAEDVVLAALRTASDLPPGEEGLRQINESGFAVTFFNALERCTPGQLDNDRYGIVVRSLERPDKMGGALPRMPGITSEWEQFQHARIKNGQLVSFEPYDIFRHEVVKAVEPKMLWQPTGVPAPSEPPWHKDPRVCGLIANRARDLVLAQMFGCAETTARLADDLLAGKLDSLYLTIYIAGHLRGCMGQVLRNLDDDLRRMAEAALNDARFTGEQRTNEDTDPASIAVTVSLLFDPLEMGAALPEDIGPYYRHGDQTLMVYQGDRVGLLLPFVAATSNLDRVSFPKAVVEKAGLTEPPYYWCRFDCTTWLADSNGVSPTLGAFPLRPPNATTTQELIAHHAALHISYLINHLRADGSLYSSYEPFQNRLYEGVDLPRLAHGAWVLARAHKVLGGDEVKSAADSVIANLLNRISEDGEQNWLSDVNESSSIAEVSSLLLALTNLPPVDPRRALIGPLVSTLWSCIELPHGRILTHRPPQPSPEAFQDYFPGQALLALAEAAASDPSTIDEEKLHRSFRYYRHRFRYQRNFGQVSWLLQAFSKWWQVTGDRSFAAFVFEVADWILGYQQEKTGAFINDHQPATPGYTTALYLEGIAAAMTVAHGLGDDPRYQAYFDSCSKGFRFLDHLIIQKRDRSILPNPDFAFGGLRQGLYYSEIRTDFVQHSLSAILEFMAGRNAQESA
jgi:orotate phosphoribosyltransferase/AMMECR1 domain-containing protein